MKCWLACLKLVHSHFRFWLTCCLVLYRVQNPLNCLSSACYCFPVCPITFSHLPWPPLNLYLWISDVFCLVAIPWYCVITLKYPGNNGCQVLSGWHWDKIVAKLLGLALLAVCHLWSVLLVISETKINDWNLIERSRWCDFGQNLATLGQANQPILSLLASLISFNPPMWLIPYDVDTDRVCLVRGSTA
jgi:hypothetical protein